MTTKQREKAEAIARLKEWLSPGDTVYTLVTHVSSSGMSRAIRFLLIEPKAKRGVYIWHPNHAIGTVLGLRFHTRRGQHTDALIVHGCGFDAGRHCVDSLSTVLGFPLQQEWI